MKPLIDVGLKARWLNQGISETVVLELGFGKLLHEALIVGKFSATPMFLQETICGKGQYIRS